MNKVNFNGMEITNSGGSMRIIRWAPNRGFDEFIWNVLVRRHSADTLEEFRFPDAAPGRFRGELVVSDGDLTTATCPEIDLVHIETGIDQRYKEMRIRFQYDRNVINAAVGAPDPEFGFPDIDPPASGPLRTTYRAKIDGNPENLIEARSFTTDVASTVVRLASVRTGAANSALTRVLRMHKTHNAARRRFTGFTYEFTKQDLKISPRTLDTIEVIELAGTGLDEPLPAVEGYVTDNGRPSLLSGGLTGNQLLDHHRNSRVAEDDDLPIGEPLQVVTIKFRPGYARNINLT
jgi:hypothetical protein